MKKKKFCFLLIIFSTQLHMNISGIAIIIITQADCRLHSLAAADLLGFLDHSVWQSAQNSLHHC